MPKAAVPYVLLVLTLATTAYPSQTCNFTTGWGDYELYSPSDGSVAITSDVVRFDASATPATDTLIFYPASDRGLEVAALTETHGFYPQVTVDKGTDGNVDIVVAWTEANNVAATDGPYFPTDGDVYYRQFTLSFLGP